MSDEEEECPECPAMAGWVMTFADLMSLLMCFFVLLLSFSEMDAQKFKRLAGSLRNAFGVQNVVKVQDVPKGTSIIAQEFSPGRPDPTPLNIIRQFTQEITESSLEIFCQDEITRQETMQGDTGKNSREVVLNDESLEQKSQEVAIQAAAKLEEEISDGQVELETQGKKVVIRIREHGSFKAGSDYIADRFLPVLDKIRALLVETPGKISVEGHTDDIPVKGGKFRSNWHLSSARAVAVADELFVAPELDEKRFMVVGHASTQPLVKGKTPEARERNRRVEIIILQTNEDDDDNEPLLDINSPDIQKKLEYNPEDHELKPDEIY